MSDKINKLLDLNDLLKSNVITKEEFEILKKEILSDFNLDLNIKTKPDIEYSNRQRIVEQQALRLKSNINKRQPVPKSNVLEPITGTQSFSKPPSIGNSDTLEMKYIIGIILLAVFVIIIIYPNNSKTSNSTSPPNSSSSSSNTYEKSRESDDMANCVVCGKRVDYSHENSFSGHHVKIGGLMSSDVVCGLDCEITLLRRNERTINREMRDPNSYRDPDINYPDFNK